MQFRTSTRGKQPSHTAHWATSKCVKVTPGGFTAPAHLLNPTVHSVSMPQATPVTMAVTLGVTYKSKQGQRLGFNIVTLWAGDTSCPAALRAQNPALPPGLPSQKEQISQGRNVTLQFHEVHGHLGRCQELGCRAANMSDTQHRAPWRSPAGWAET